MGGSNRIGHQTPTRPIILYILSSEILSILSFFPLSRAGGGRMMRGDGTH